MNRALLFLLFAALLRLAAAALRADPPRRPLRLAGWGTAMIAAWIAASGAGAWSPFGPTLGAMLLGAPLEWKRRRTLLRVPIEWAFVLLLCFLSVPPLPLLRAAVFASLWTMFALALDRLLLRRKWAFRTAAALLPFAAAGAIGFLHPWAVTGARRAVRPALGPSRLFFLAVGPAGSAEKIVLPGGSVAWFEPSPDGADSPAALVLHGADRRGSAQAAALVIRRALRDAGYSVLSLDHPGYGASALPDTARVEAWDPLPDETAAYDSLYVRTGGAPIILVGHSMGVYEAIRLLAARPGGAGAALFGGSMKKRGPLSDYWYERFHSDRRMEKRLPRERVNRIDSLYYDAHALLRRLPANRTSILFVRFEKEHEDVEATRDVLFARLPQPKEARDLEDSNHYFNAGARAGIVAADIRAARRTAALFSWFRQEIDR